MNPTLFTQQVQAMSDRLMTLYQGINPTIPLSADVLPAALKELGIATARLEDAAKLLHQQERRLSSADLSVEAERQQFQALLDFLPDACLLTDTAGNILRTNRAAARLLNLSQPLLNGRSIATFFTSETRSSFQRKLEQLQQTPWQQKWQVCLQPHQGTAAIVRAFVEISKPVGDQPVTVFWLLRDPTPAGAIDLAAPGDNVATPAHLLQVYHKREAIPLDPHVIWQVQSGLVKLTTFADSGQEILIGLAGVGAPFGASLTALPLYEATALANTQLRCLPLSEVKNSVDLKQWLLPQISQRLKQAELLLAVYGQPKVLDRLHNLLQLLKQEIGESVPGGTRLSVRLTHEDLATACCTTRVTITRLLSQLQQENQLSVDAQYHLVLKG
jgi:PAS domain S-box-containing protein